MIEITLEQFKKDGGIYIKDGNDVYQLNVLGGKLVLKHMSMSNELRILPISSNSISLEAVPIDHEQHRLI